MNPVETRKVGWFVRVHDFSSKALSSNATFRQIWHHVERDYSSNFRRKTTRRMDICRNFVENLSKFGRKMRCENESNLPMRMRLEMTGVIVYTTNKMWCLWNL